MAKALFSKTNKLYIIRNYEEKGLYMNTNSLYDMVIVGAGPAGISLAVEAIKAKVPQENIVVLEKFENHSWSIRKFYPEDKLVTANYKGNDVKCQGNLCLLDSTKTETLDYLSDAIRCHHLDVRYNHRVDEIKKLKNGQYIVCSNDECFVTKTIGIAIGVLGKPNRPDYPIPSNISKNVFFDVTSKKFENESILVVGGGDSASEYCQFLANKNNKVTLSYRKDQFLRMNDINRNYIESLNDQNKVNLLLSSNIAELKKDNDRIRVQFTEHDDMVVDSIIFALGGTTPRNFLEGIGIKMTKEGPEVSDFFEAKHEGIFVLGDLTAGKSGGSINVAFNSSHKAIKEVCKMYLDCKL